MSLKAVLMSGCCLLALLAGCASVDTLENNPGDSMLVIGAQLRVMDRAGQVSNNGYLVSAVSIKNLDSDRVYTLPLASGHAVSRLPAGLYCVDSVRPAKSTPLTYCNKPFFRLAPGKIMVAGYFIFAIDYGNQNYILSQALVDRQALFDQLSKAELQSLQNFDAGKS